MKLLKAFAKDTLSYGVGNAIKKLIAFLLLPLYTRVLTPADYGVLDTLGAGALILSILFGMRVIEGGARYYYEANSQNEKGVILFTVFILNLLSLIPSFLLALFSSEISVFLFNTTEYSWVVFAACLSIPLILINDEQSWIYRYKMQPWKFNIYILSRAIINVVMGIVLVLHLRKGVLGAQLATIISLSVTILFSLLTFSRQEYVYRFSFSWAKKIIKFSYPLMLAALVTWIYTSADRYLLLGYKSTVEVGLYSIGLTLTGPLSILNMAIGMSFYPFFMSQYEKETDENKAETKSISNQIWNIYLVISLFICSVLSIFGKEIIGFVATPNYEAAALAIPFLLFSAIFRQSIDIASIGIFLKEKTIHYTWLVALTSGVSLILNFILIPVISFQGAALSNMVANLVYLVIAYNLSQKYFPIKRSLEKIIVYISVVFIIANLIPILQFNFNIDVSLIIKFILLLFCLIIPFLLKLITIQKLKNIIKG